MSHLKTSTFAVSLALLLAATFSSAVDAQVQSKLQAAIFIKLLNYDAALASKKQKQIKFHIVLEGKTKNKKASLKSDFGVISRKKIANKSVLVVTTDISALASATDSKTAHVYYLPSGTSKATLDTTLAIAKSKKIPLLAGSVSLAQSGAAVGIGVNGNVPQIVVNLKQCKAVGMNLSSQLLKLAKII